MEPFVPKSKLGPEALIRKKGVARLRNKGWFVKGLHGNAYQQGFPDDYATHPRYGPRWIEWKSGKPGCRLEESQEETFTEFSKRRVGVWILTSDSEYELARLFAPANWIFYLDIMKIVTRSRERKTPPKEIKRRIESFGPERDIQEAVKKDLLKLGWYCLDTHGNMYQHGFPDLYACHRDYGARWIEIKRPTGYSFTPAQVETFPLLVAHGSGVWIMDAPDQVDRLFKPSNWYKYLETMK